MQPSSKRYFSHGCVLTLLMFASMLVAGCGEATDPPPEPEPVEVTALGRGQNAQLPGTFEHSVIRTREEWETLTAQLRTTEALPQVNFDEEMVLLAARRVNTGGYSIQFDSVEWLPEEDMIVARYTIGVPHDDCMTTMAVATPFHVISIPRTDAEVRFESRQEVYRCSMRRGL